MSDVLIVAFDGLDKELIEKFDLKNIVQDEFGKIDNSTAMSTIKTTELFTSFITGTNYQDHGIMGLSKAELTKRQKAVSLFTPSILVENIPGMYRLRSSLRALTGLDTMKYSRNDIDSPVIFEEINNSKSLFVPGYSTSIFSDIGAGLLPLKYGYSPEETEKYRKGREFEYRKRKTFREVNKYFDLFMVHFHRPDFFQHMVDDGTFEEEELEDLYREMDELAARVLNYFEEDFEYIIFMSDHGLPQGDSHNENAFYSCNKELFGDQQLRLQNSMIKFMSYMRIN